MRLTKDEARILALALKEEKYNLNDSTSNKIEGYFEELVKLENKLDKFGKDKRRTGRTSLNDNYNLAKRFKCAENE